VVVAWLVAQVLQLVFESFGTPDWVMKTLLVLLATGLPFAAFFAWAFELTPEGIKRDAGRGQPTPAGPGSRHWFNFIIIGVLAAAVAFVLLDKYVLDKGRGKPAAIGGDGGIVSIAVLPLASLNSGSDKEFLADGMTASLITELSKIEALRVISRTSVQKYRDNTMSLPDIARELNAAAVIEGTVLSIKDKVRVSASLIPAEQDTAIWTQTYDRDLGDVLALHSEISRAIAEQVRITLTAADASRLTPATPVDASVLEAIMRGQYIFAQTNGSKGLDLLESATVMAPKYAKGWAETGKLEIEDGEGTGFGRSVAVSASDLLVGAPSDNDGSGNVYHFQREQPTTQVRGRFGNPVEIKSSESGCDQRLMSVTHCCIGNQ